MITKTKFCDICIEVKLISEKIDNENDNLEQTYACPKCGRKTFYVYQLIKCYDEDPK